MANEWYSGDWDEGLGDFFEPPPPDVNEILFGSSDIMDQHAQDLFSQAFFDNNDAAYIDLVDYMWDEYGIDFEQAFDWEDFRDYYEGAH